MSTRATIVGSGPNGLSAAITLAQAGVETTVYEAADTLGGCMQSAESTLPGFLHDLGAAAFPLGYASPFFQSLPLADYGLEWIHSPASLAHPSLEGETSFLWPSLDETAKQLGPDRDAWMRLYAPLCEHWDALLEDILHPLLRVPRHPILMARFGAVALLPAATAARLLFRGERARTLFLGMAAHTNLPLTQAATSAVALVLGAAAHTGGWPIVRGGAQSLTDALVSHLRSLSGKIVTAHAVETLPPMGRGNLVLCDTSPHTLATMAGKHLPDSEQRKLKSLRYGPGIFKMDWALSQPIPWRDSACQSAATVHLGWPSAAILTAEKLPSHGTIAEHPFILLIQPSLFDTSRAPAGKHTAWAYCHVPAGGQKDAITQIESQIERFAQGFRDCILARATRTARQMEQWNPNLVGGDISGGAMTLRQTLFRPTARSYRTSVSGLFLCSSSTPPGGGVHGMCGYNAALEALQSLRSV